MRRLLSVSFLAGLLLVLAFAGDRVLESDTNTTNAAGPCASFADAIAGLCNATAMSVDTQESATPANTAGTGDNGVIGSIEDCSRINENDILDADEDSVDALFVDIQIDDVPPYSDAGTPGDPTDDYGGIISHTFDLSYDETHLTIQSETYGLVGARAGSAVSGVSDTTPDIDGNDNFASANLDTSSSVPESGDGFLSRFLISSDAGAVTGNYALTLLNNAHLDVSGSAQIPTATNNGSISINQACPETADLKATAATTVSPASNPAAPSTFVVSVSGTVHNNGGSYLLPVNADISVSLNLPSDCTTTTTNPTVIQDQLLALSVPTNVGPVNFTVSCTDPSAHTFTGTVTVAEDDSGWRSTPTRRTTASLPARALPLLSRTLTSRSRRRASAASRPTRPRRCPWPPLDRRRHTGVHGEQDRPQQRPYVTGYRHCHTQRLRHQPRGRPHGQHVHSDEHDSSQRWRLHPRREHGYRRQ